MNNEAGKLNLVLPDKKNNSTKIANCLGDIATLVLRILLFYKNTSIYK